MVVVCGRGFAEHQVTCILYSSVSAWPKIKPDIPVSQVWLCDTSSQRLGQHAKANIFLTNVARERA